MTLDEVRLLIAQTQSPAQRAAAEQLLQEALALPHLPPEQRDAAIVRIRTLERTAPDYQLQSHGANVLEIIGDSLTDPARKKVAYAEALHLAEWYASGASSAADPLSRKSLCDFDDDRSAPRQLLASARSERWAPPGRCTCWRSRPSCRRSISTADT